VYQTEDLLRELVERLDRIERRLELNVEKEAYTVEEAAERLNRSPWTVRQWCNKGQVEDAYKVHGKGRTGEWRIPHAELVRLQNEGPLPEGSQLAA
jgi:transposase